MTRTVDDYAGRITPWQAKPIKARFLATVRTQVQPYADAQVVIASLPSAFDLDSAVGAQLDVDGLWIGRSRNFSVPLPSLYFSFDVQALGWDEGYWDGPYGTAYAQASLPDELYRKLLYAKVLANSWDGTLDSAVDILTTYLDDPATKIFIDDDAAAVTPPLYFSFDDPTRGFDVALWEASGNTDPLSGPLVPPSLGMSFRVAVAGKIPSPSDLTLLGNGLIGPTPMGATVSYSVTTVDEAPLFGWDVSNDYIDGWDQGAWDGTPEAVIDQSS